MPLTFTNLIETVEIPHSFEYEWFFWNLVVMTNALLITVRDVC